MMKNIVLGMALMAACWSLVAYTIKPEDVAIAISNDKMNVLYMGVENPISIGVTGALLEDIEVSGQGCGINLTPTKLGAYYRATVTMQGETSIMVRHKKLQKIIANYQFRVKRIPDPVARLGGKTGGIIGNGELKSQIGLIASLENFDLNANCEIQSFELHHIPQNEDPAKIAHTGGRFSGRVSAIVANAKVGDQYHFINIKARCPGDVVARTINNLSFTVK